MTTILTQGDSDGERRCDAKCHNAAPGSSCDCICGGRYQAKGSSSAAQAQLTEDCLGKDWREKFAGLTLAQPELPL